MILKALGGTLLALLLAGPLQAQEISQEARGRCWGSNPNAPVVIEVFSDFSCPHCRELYLRTIRAVMADYATAGKVCVVYYEFPLRGNRYSRQAARWAHAAIRLGPQKWLRVMDTLFRFQGRWTRDGQIEPILASVLSEEEMNQLRQWVEDPRVNVAIDRDLTEGRQRNVQRTPTFFISANGETERFVGSVQYGILRRYLNNLLARR
ncbi:MAG: thioredoxin domain-containing protein [Candidatus Acidoferrales bacterium]